ncbi:MAG: hypothetical protein QOE70_127 [Chthoniobacter sp.]|jgi:hypothetical protein|nr:hypothetical protein [Chthoniobacter sp.]
MDAHFQFRGSNYRNDTGVARRQSAPCERPRMSETQTDMSSRCSILSVEIQVALLLLGRTFDIGKIGA